MTEPKESKNPKRNSKANEYARYSGIAIQMLAIIAIGSYGGVKLDEWYPNTYNAYTIICSLVSVGIAMYIVIKQATNTSKKNDT